MHFWIDKRNQIHGRRFIPTNFYGYGRNQRNLCGGFYPKPMVTPVHRFQSIESVANNGLRSSRGPYYSPRLSYPQTAHYNGSSSNIRSPNVARSMDMISIGTNQTTTPRRTRSKTTKFKCGVWALFALFFFLFAGFKYYGHGINIGVEAIVFCVIVAVISVIGGIVWLCEALKLCKTPNAPPGDIANITQIEDTHEEVPTNVQIAVPMAELPPPPYHIAVMLSPQNEMETIQVIRDSPPPSYEKAVT